MTNVIVLGQEPNEKKDLTPIKFCGWVSSDIESNNCSVRPKDWKNIELICANYLHSGKDLMFAYNDNRNDGVCYLGHFNDGVV